MNILKHKYLLTLPLMLVFATAAAQETGIPDSREFTLGDCISIGLEKNYAVRISRNEQRIAENNATRGNAGQLPVLDFGATFSGTYYDHDNKMPEGTPDASFNQRGNYVDLGPTLGWTAFDGLSLTTNYARLRELAAMGELNTKLTLEDFVASISAEYYTLIRQKIRLANLKASVDLSRERVRIVEESYHIGAASGLDFQQAQVDFNADNSAYLSQIELVRREQIELSRMMGLDDVESMIIPADTVIYPNAKLDGEKIWNEAVESNTSLLISRKNRTLSELDLRQAQSRNYPYLRLSAGYGYRHSWDNYNTYVAQNRLGFNYGVSAGITIFDGMNRRREQRNAKIEIENRQLSIEQLEQSLRSNMATLWLAYTNNLTLWDIEKDNLVVARSNFEIAMERYRLRELSGIELREAQLSLLQSEERLSTAEYNIKLCEISLYQLSGEILDLTGGIPVE